MKHILKQIILLSTFFYFVCSSISCNVKKSVSSDTINEGLCVRPKKDGDKILHGGIHKKLKKLYCEKRLTAKERASLPVFCDKDGIVWIPGIALRDKESKKNSLALVTLFYN